MNALPNFILLRTLHRHPSTTHSTLRRLYYPNTNALLRPYQSTPRRCTSPPLGPTPTPSSSSSSGLVGKTILDEYRRRKEAEYRRRNQSLLLYGLSIGVITLGLSYAAVPMYRVFCSVTGYNGTPTTSTGKFAPDRINSPVGNKLITIRFNADKSDSLNWKFWPCQKSVTVKPGETVLAFYKARNLDDHDVLGVATYNVTPGQVAPYFAKVECFCFDEQRLLAGEEIDLPVFFFIDKDFIDDPLMQDIDDIVLTKRNSYGYLEPDIPDNTQ